jgi:hypothetical protein
MKFKPSTIQQRGEYQSKRNISAPKNAREDNVSRLKTPYSGQF